MDETGGRGERSTASAESRTSRWFERLALLAIAIAAISFTWQRYQRDLAKRTVVVKAAAYNVRNSLFELTDAIRREATVGGKSLPVAFRQKAAELIQTRTPLHPYTLYLSENIGVEGPDSSVDPRQIPELWGEQPPSPAFDPQTGDFRLVAVRRFEDEPRRAEVWSVTPQRDMTHQYLWISEEGGLRPEVEVR